jgi:hypothetical protein
MTGIAGYCPKCNQPLMAGATACDHGLAWSTTPAAPRPCFVCGKSLPSCTPGPLYQALGGAGCTLHGNYGSSVFDNLTDAPREFAVCDDCLMARIERTFARPTGRTA